MVSQAVGKKLVDALAGVMEAGAQLLREKGYEAVGATWQEPDSSGNSSKPTSTSTKPSPRLPDKPTTVEERPTEKF